MRLGFVMPTRVDNPEREEWRKFSLFIAFPNSGF